jgi:hypothetical protein
MKAKPMTKRMNHTIRASQMFLRRAKYKEGSCMGFVFESKPRFFVFFTLIISTYLIKISTKGFLQSYASCSGKKLKKV